MRHHLTALACAAFGLVAFGVLAPSALAAPAGYRIVNGPTVNAPPGGFDSGSQLTCPTGTVPLGGGVAGNAFTDMSLNTSGPLPNGWEARVNNPDSPTGFLALDVICAKKPKGYTVAFATADNPPGARSVATATCPANTVVLSGGVLSTSDRVGARVLGAWPVNSTTFRAAELNATASDERLTAEAVCASKPTGYVVARQAFTEAPNTLDIGGASCPAGKSVLGGGIHITGGDTTAFVHSSVNNQKTGWSVNVTTGSLPLGLAFSAICAA
jgi:hypothetical protein